MANQKEIRVRIGSTKKTMKITSAMKLVAAAKVNKMQKKLIATRPYAEKITQLFANLLSSLTDDDIQEQALLQSKNETNTVLLVVVSSDRGLCGAYTSNVVKAASRRIRELQDSGKKIKLITVGRKAKTALGRSLYTEQGIEIVEAFMNLSSMPTNHEASLIAQLAINKYVSGEVDRVELITTNFISLVASETVVCDFLPIKTDIIGDKKLSSEPQSMTICEPNVQSLISTLLPMYTENRIYQALLEATTSELAARMTAMSNATSNAKEVIKKLTLSYNKARQASITQEISEIVGGAAALAA